MRWMLAASLFLAVLPAFGECAGWIAFRAPVRYASSADHTVFVRDLDGDGAPEILASGNQVDELEAFSILPNRGDGTFGAELRLATGFGETLQAVGDLDGDHFPDLVASDYWSNGIRVYHAEGALRFDAGTFYATATHGGPSLIVDYDRDGVPDVASLSFGSGNPLRIHLFRGHGDGTLAPKSTFETGLANGETPAVRTIGGALEILVSDRSARLGILRWAGGTLSASTLAAGPGINIASTFGDVDGDAIPDVLDGDDSAPSPWEPIFITLANADGTFRERRQIEQPRTLTFPVELRVADVDGDGRGDLIVADYHATHVALFRGLGAETFEASTPLDAGAPVNAFDLGDVNGDGRTDVVTANADHTMSVLVNGGPCRAARQRAVAH